MSDFRQKIAKKSLLLLEKNWLQKNKIEKMRRGGYGLIIQVIYISFRVHLILYIYIYIYIGFCLLFSNFDSKSSNNMYKENFASKICFI